MHVDAGALFHDRYFSALLQGMTDVLSENAVGMMLWLGNRSREETLRRILEMRTLDGVIATADLLEDPIVDGLLAASLPTVLIGHRREDLSASYVDIDHARAADVVTTHLIGLGRTRVGHITGRRGTVAGEDRLQGFLRAMRRAGQSGEDAVEAGDFTVSGGAAAAGLLIDRGVDAIFCASDATAEGALGAIRARGLRVPSDIALAGFDDLEFAAALDPPLTTIRQGVEQQGAEAAHTLFQLMDDPESGPRRVLLPTELVIRQSTAGGIRGGGRAANAS
jgi:LacI family transcriptional regulator